MEPVVRLIGLRAEPLSVDEVLGAVADPGAGGTCVFVGTVREQDGGRAVSGLDYTAHPSVEETLRRVAAAVAEEHQVRAIAAVHRVGDLVVGDLAVVVAAAAPHRGTAFAACRQLIDDLKREVPVWKHQRFTDGGQEWVGSP
ncbi:MAG TPA: molybdenum cofactor biosynthesis protein MoaE [Jiangellales bacterium]|nr:molybdenum cofactor biosynthesis protein MoaE [Jiangellales bacterium]